MTRAELIAELAPLSNCDEARLGNLYDRAVEACKIDGDIVECGCGHGASSAMLAAVIGEFAPDKMLILCDTFEGLPPPDRAVDKAHGWTEKMYQDVVGSASSPAWYVRSLCKKYHPQINVDTVKGRYEDTLAFRKFPPIALLHADADWYSSTKAILENLWKNVVEGAPVIFDDFFYWSGCAKAVDEFFQAHPPWPAIKQTSCAAWCRKPPQRKE